MTLDTSALIAVERGDPRLQALLDEAMAAGAELAVPAGVVAEAWRASTRRGCLARFLALDTVRVVALDEPEARATGALCARGGTGNVVGASVVLCARVRGHAVVTGDPEDLAALDPSLTLWTLR